MPLVAFAGHPIAIEFLFGVAIALAPQKDENRQKCAGARDFVAVDVPQFPISTISCATRGRAYALQRLALWGIPSALIVFGPVCQEDKLEGGPGHEVPLLLGAASYSIYLVHSLATALV